MSLLNDALRAAEQRQGRPGAPAAYTGQPIAARAGRQRGLWLLMAAALVMAVLAGWWLLSEQTPELEKPATPVTGSRAAEPEPALEPATATEPEQMVAVAPVTPEPEPDLEAAPPATEREPELKPAVTKVPEPQPTTVGIPVRKDAAVEASPQVGTASSEASAEAPVANTAGVKQVRDTPEVVDRRTSRELGRLLRAGRWAEARQRLQALTETQDAPLSRHVMAKRLLIEGETDQALALLPEPVAQTSAPLRLLRARALLARGSLAAALATLQARVPEVADHSEYHVTLATLLHQSGRNDEAARRWAELIAWDDSRAPWWAGLAITLESSGQPEAARRAFEQAAVLPGLPPSLAEYVRQRLQSLRAG
ncbi:hypothetical protein [Marinobacter lipolyticus]|uniref:hypothetical protein n=1 Tax=Marinobacter lipolyticus TaxID=209639 RepID=UPI001BCF8313|nr:hypothetical protein [Marinobacter lipolyticus]